MVQRSVHNSASFWRRNYLENPLGSMIHGAQYEDDDGGSFTTTPTFFQTLEYLKSGRNPLQWS